MTVHTMKKTGRKIIAGLTGAVICNSASVISPVMADDSFILGDFNNDGEINAVDATEILQYYSDNSTGESFELSEEIRKSADIDGDGEILATDATWVLMYYAYLSVEGKVNNISDFRYYTEITDNMASYDGNIYEVMDVTESYDFSANQLNLNWKPMENATGYRVDVYTDQYYDENGQPFRYSGDVSECQFTAQLPAELSADNNYRYRITPYFHYEDFETDCGRKYADGSLGTYFLTGDRPYNSIKFRVNSADLHPHDSYALYDIRYNNGFDGQPVRVNAYGYRTQQDAFFISDNDRELLETFIEENFTPDMTNYDRIIYLMEWIHDNIEYATEEQYQEHTMWDGNFIKDVLEIKAGQCLQYNGALAEYLAYLGYDTYMLRMYTEGGVHHYRAELNIDDIVYGMEVGDKGSDNPETDYKWLWAFDMNQPMLINRPD